VTAPAFLGIDLGTARVKVGLVSPSGELLALARASHPLDVDAASGRAEQDVDAWWTGLRRAVAEVLTSTAVGTAEPIEIRGIAIAGQGPTTTPVDEGGNPTGPAITWLDSRAARERDELEAATGLRGWALGVLPAALRLERVGAATASTRWYLNSWEAMTLRLTGRAATTLVPSQPFPDSDTIAAAGLDPRRIAPTCPVGSVVGGLTNDPAAALGLAAGTPVVAGLVDAFASFHGAGMTKPGDAIDVGGAAGGFGVYWDRRLDAPGGFTTPAPLPGLWSVGGAMAATGAALDWLASDVLGDAVSVPDLIEEAASVEPGAAGLVFLPYLAGERSPLWDASARGVLAGLTLGHGRAEIARAVLEGAALAIRHISEPILEAGVRVDAMRVCGGPAHSAAWNRIKADVTGFEVAVPRVLETTVLGAAIVAAVGTDAQPDVPSAIRSMTSFAERIHPNAVAHARYDDVYRRYRELYPAIAPVLERGEAAPIPVGAGT
jgi:xylulokinase